MPASALPTLGQEREVVPVASLPEALARLQAEPFAGIYISALDPALWQQARALLQNEAILEVLGEGIAILQPDSRIVWANSTFEAWCGGATQGRVFYEVLGSPVVLGPDFNPISSALQGTCV